MAELMADVTMNLPHYTICSLFRHEIVLILPIRQVTAPSRDSQQDLVHFVVLFHEYSLKRILIWKLTDGQIKNQMDVIRSL